jgi:hypothetical protein
MKCHRHDKLFLPNQSAPRQYSFHHHYDPPRTLWVARKANGLQNSPEIHQHHVTVALCEYNRKICHIYLNDIVIWSKNIADRTKYIDLIIKALKKARMYCNPKKCKFFHEEIDFLGHHISSRGVEPNSSKVDCIMQWLTPKCSTNVHTFLGLIRYIVNFLPQLADYTTILTPLTTKEC